MENYYCASLSYATRVGGTFAVTKNLPFPMQEMCTLRSLEYHNQSIHNNLIRIVTVTVLLGPEALFSESSGSNEVI